MVEPYLFFIAGPPVGEEFGNLGIKIIFLIFHPLINPRQRYRLPSTFEIRHCISLYNSSVLHFSSENNLSLGYRDFRKQPRIIKFHLRAPLALKNKLCHNPVCLAVKRQFHSRGITTSKMNGFYLLNRYSQLLQFPFQVRYSFFFTLPFKLFYSKFLKWLPGFENEVNDAQDLMSYY